MDGTKKKLMSSHHSELLDLTNCTTTFLAVFISAGVLEDNEVQLIEAEKTKSAKNAKLYETLKDKCDGFEILLKAARDKKQSGLVKVLEKIESLSAAEASAGPQGILENSRLSTNMLNASVQNANIGTPNRNNTQSGHLIERGQVGSMQQPSNPSMTDIIQMLDPARHLPPEFRAPRMNSQFGYGMLMQPYAPAPDNFQGYDPFNPMSIFGQPPVQANLNTQPNFGHPQQHRAPMNTNMYPQTQPLSGNQLHSQNSPGTVSSDVVDIIMNKKPLDVEVVKPEGDEMSFPDDHYKLPKYFKGYALVLNITEFSDPSKNRIGAHNDTNYMHKLWTELGYQVTCKTGRIDKMEAKVIIGKFVAKFSDGVAQSSVVFIGSHGVNNGIETSDGGTLHLYKDIVYEFDTIKCPKLDGKAKLFFVQACQNFATDNADKKPEAPPINSTLVSFSVIPGYESLRDHHVGTYYTYCLAKVFMEEAWRTNLLTLLEKVQDEMGSMITEAGQTQMSTYLSMGFIQHLYFNLESI